VVGYELEGIRDLALGIFEVFNIKRLGAAALGQLFFEGLPCLIHDADREQMSVEHPGAISCKPRRLYNPD